MLDILDRGWRVVGFRRICLWTTSLACSLVDRCTQSELSRGEWGMRATLFPIACELRDGFSNHSVLIRFQFLCQRVFSKGWVLLHDFRRI